MLAVSCELLGFTMSLVLRVMLVLATLCVMPSNFATAANMGNMKKPRAASSRAKPSTQTKKPLLQKSEPSDEIDRKSLLAVTATDHVTNFVDSESAAALDNIVPRVSLFSGLQISRQE